MKIYTASSWKNKYYSAIVEELQASGHEVYDFRKAISTKGSGVAFNWEQIDPNWESWTPEQFEAGLNHKLAVNAFESDYYGMLNAEACVLILPCGKSAHIEAGFMKGMGKKLYLVMPEKDRPELTYSIANGIFSNVKQLLEVIK